MVGFRQLTAASIRPNIAARCRRRGERDLARLQRIALGSASEVEYHLLLAFDLGLVEADEDKALDARVAEAKRMLRAFIRKLSDV